MSNGEGNSTPLLYSCLENPMDGGAWWAAVHEVAKSQTRLSDFTFTFHFHALKREMATHSSVLAWRIPGTGVPVGLPSMGSQRVRHDWSDLPEPAGKVDQVPRTCTAGLRKKLKQETTKIGSRGSDTSPRRDAVWHQLYSTSHIYTEKREKDKTVDIFSWLAYTSYKQSQEILRAWEWLPVIISYTR